MRYMKNRMLLMISVLLVFCLAGYGNDDGKPSSAQATAESAVQETVPVDSMSVGSALGGWSPSGDMPAEWGDWKRVYFFSDRMVILTKEDETAEYPYEFREEAVLADGQEIRLSGNGGLLLLQWGERTMALDRYETDYPFAYEVTENNTIRITEQVIDAQGDFAFPAEIGGMPVEAIDCTFHQPWEVNKDKPETGLKIVFVPEGVREIGNNGLCRLEEGLRYCSLPSTLKTIGDRTFYRCRSLASVTIPEGVENIGRNAFNNSGLTAITLPKSLKNAENAASGMQELAEVRILSDDVVLSGMFAQCPKLKKVTINGGTVYLRESFSGCEALEEIVIDGGTVSLLGSSLFRCPALKKITVAADAKLGVVNPRLPVLKQEQDFEGADLLKAAAASPDTEYYYLSMEIREKTEVTKEKLANEQMKRERRTFVYDQFAPEMAGGARSDPAAASERIHEINSRLREQQKQDLGDPAVDAADVTQVLGDEMEAFLTGDLTYEKISAVLAKGLVKSKAIAEIIGHGLEKDDFSKKYPVSEKDQWKVEKVEAVLAELTTDEIMQIRLKALYKSCELENIDSKIAEYEQELAELEAQLAELEASRKFRENQ